jgi:hypothetical protein
MLHKEEKLIRGGWAVLMLAAGLLFSASRASAECGDYIIIQQGRKSPQQPTAHHPSDSQSLTLKEKGHRSKAPCHGPNCSGLPSREPASPAPAPTFSQAKEPASHTSTTREMPQSDAPLVADEAFSRPILRTKAIFHPPRFA